MDTKEQIIQIADSFIRDKGFNAFSFYDISNKVGIKTASIHYHFPSKADLGVAVIDSHIQRLSQVIKEYQLMSPSDKLDKFFSIYNKIINENRICLVGSLATDFNTLDEKVRLKLKEFSEMFLIWVSEFLEEGKKKNIFDFEGESRTKALMIISNMLAIVQLSRLTTPNDFEVVKKTIQQELMK